MIPKKYSAMVSAIERVDGMCTTSGIAWEAVLSPGFCYDGTHVITAETKTDLRNAFASIEPCSCEQCKPTPP